MGFYREILQEAYRDAKNHEYEILVVYKDDRIGRRMWEIGGYIMSLKSLGVDIYTVKDGCISPDSNDIMGQMMLALRYGNAQKSSADTYFEYQKGNSVFRVPVRNIAC